MDFDSLKVTAKLNASSYESKGLDTFKASPDVNTSSSNEVDSGSAINSDTTSAATQNEAVYTGEEFINKLSKAVDMANESLKALMINRQFSYRIHEATNRVIVDVKNSDTGEIIKEIPSEDNLDMIAKMQELAGIIIDEKR